MADESNILREYLIALGFKVDPAATKRFGTTISALDKSATKLSRGIVGVGVAAQVMATEFAFRMEKLYYSSKLAESAAGNLQALNFGGKQVGIANITEQVTNLARAVRANPGLQGLLNSLGVRVTGRDMSDVASDLVAQLSKMPFYIAQRYAQMFGIDADTLKLWIDGQKEIAAATKNAADAASDMGVNTEDAVRAGLEYARTWREILLYANLFKDAVTIQMLPAMQELGGVTKELLRDWIKLVNTPRKDFVGDLMLGLGLQELKPGVVLNQESKDRIGQERPEGLWDRFMSWRRGRENARRGRDPLDPAAVEAVTAPDRRLLGQAAEQAPAAAPSPSVVAGADRQTLMQELERRYALPPGQLDRAWKRESNRGDPRFMRSPAGAEGHFGFMPPTAKQYGVKDPNDFSQAAAGAAKYFADLLKKYGGDEKFAAAAYNWGPGNLDRAMAKAMEKNPNMTQMELDRYVLGSMPKETRDYVNSVAPDGKGAAGGVTIHQENNISVTGSGGGARETADEIAEQLRTVNGDTVRQLTQRIF